MRLPKKFRIRHFIVLSLLIHAISVVTVVIAKLAEPQKHIETVQFDVVPAEPAKPEAMAKVERIKKTLEVRKNQIVDQDEKPLNDEKPEDARFLSRNNQVVKKQTMARERGEFKNKASKEARGNGGEVKKPTLNDFKPQFDAAKAVDDLNHREKEFEQKVADGDMPVPVEKQEAQNKPEENPNKEAGDQAKGAETSQSLDYIKDLDAGLETLLSTKEFVYYSYYNRIRVQLNQYWSDRVRQKLTELYKKGRSIASSEDKITKCLITLDTTGRLIKVQIIGDSGVHELDEAAVEAFRAAAPFPNPPKGMVDPDGTIKIRWDFILEA